MSVAEVDSKGRVTLPKRLRDELRLGRKVLLLKAGDHVKLIPLPADPIAALEGRFTVGKSFPELRRQAERLALREAGR